MTELLIETESPVRKAVLYGGQAVHSGEFVNVLPPALMQKFMEGATEPIRYLKAQLICRNLGMLIGLLRVRVAGIFEHEGGVFLEIDGGCRQVAVPGRLIFPANFFMRSFTNG